MEENLAGLREARQEEADGLIGSEYPVADGQMAANMVLRPEVV